MKKQDLKIKIEHKIKDSEEFVNGENKWALSNLTIEYHRGIIESLKQFLTEFNAIEVDLFENMSSLDIRFCKIESVEEILKNPKKEKSSENPVKAYKLNIFTGEENREVVTNIVDKFQPQDLVEKVTTFVLNLPATEIRGVLSRGMIVIASSKEGTLELLSGCSVGAKLF